MKRLFCLAAVVLLSVVFLSACGGGGGGGSAPPATYTISGVVSGATATGVTINLTGASTATATTATDGSYSFTGLANGNYTVTPSKTGYIFNPITLSVSVSGANATGKNFTATASTASTYSISGAVSGASDVTITLSGDNTGSVVTGAGGAYAFSGLVAGSYTVTPSLAGYTFSPTNIAITLTANSTANDFTATAIPVAHSISGAVSGATAAGVTITVTGTATATATTDASGNYTVTGLYDGSYTVTPSKTGYTFTPNSTVVTMSGANVTGKNFTATANIAPTYTLSGAVSGPYVEGVTITMSGDGSGTAFTNASGNYSFANLPAGTYTLTPSQAGYTYSPAAPAVVVSADTVQNFTASSAVVSYSISGTVSETTAKTGRIYIQAYWSGCTGGCNPVAGTSLASAGSYTIRGLQPGNYVVIAGMDYMDTGVKNATNPAGGPVAATITSANLTGINITVADRTPPAPVTPTGLMVIPSGGAAFVTWDTPQNNSGEEIATSYKIYRGTDAAASNDGSITVAARDDGYYFQTGLVNGAVYYYKISSIVNTTESAASAVVGPVTIGATTGANTVSGTITFPGTATGPMLVGVYSDTSGIYFTTIASPVSFQAYSVAGVPAGSYGFFAVIDMNNDGVFGIGDIGSTEDNPVTVSGNITKSLTLSSAGASAKVTTAHQFDGTNHNYQLQFAVEDGVKRAVAVTLVSGLNVAVPSDMGKDWNFQMWATLGAISPTVGDSYVFKVTYSDGTTETLSGSVTAVLSSFAQNLATLTNGPDGSSPAVPLFTWTAPVSPPAPYTYGVSLWGTDAHWWRDDSLPSTTLKVLYNDDGRASLSALTAGVAYSWQVRVEDTAGNRATRQATYSY